ncbi:MAG: OmpA family protein [Saprospiraceae bacterium]
MPSSWLLIPVFLFHLTAGICQQHRTTGVHASENIVPNPGFELLSSNPIGWFFKGEHFSEVMKYWDSPTNASPDVFGPEIRVPSHWAEKGFGNQKAHGGNRMVGVTCYGCTDGKPHCREYIQIQLAEPLVVNQRYAFEFWAAPLANALLISNLGASFTEDRISVQTDKVLDQSPDVMVYQVVGPSPNGWRKLSAEFQAAQASNFLTIGNFFPDSLTLTEKQNPTLLNFGYYYIDDVSLRKIEPILEVPVPEDDLTKIPLEEGLVIRLKEIFFETNQYELLPRSFIELNKLVAILSSNPDMLIEVRGHTDNRGDNDYNLYLSRKRAGAVAEYLIQQGITRNRIQFQGFGDTRPVADNSSPEGMQQNRRVEFLILKK